MVIVGNGHEDQDEVIYISFHTNILVERYEFIFSSTSYT